MTNQINQYFWYKTDDYMANNLPLGVVELIHMNAPESVIE